MTPKKEVLILYYTCNGLNIICAFGSLFMGIYYQAYLIAWVLFGFTLIFFFTGIYIASKFKL